VERSPSSGDHISLRYCVDHALKLVKESAVDTRRIEAIMLNSGGLKRYVLQEND
jgi:hypothetical protein